MISKALWRFFIATPWSTAMTIFGLALGVASIVSVHLISRTVADQLDKLVAYELSGYSYFLHRDKLLAKDYFEFRQHWRNGRYPGIEAMAPFVDERTLVDNVPVRILGVDLLLQSSRQEISTQNLADEERRSSTLLEEVWVDESLREKYSHRLAGVIEAPQGTIVSDIGVAQELLGWQQDRLSYIGVRYRDPTKAIKDLAEHLLPGISAGMPVFKPPQIVGWQVKSLADQHPANQFGKSVLFNVSALGMLALLVAWFLIYQVAVAWLRRLWPVFQRLHVLGVEHTVLRNRFLVMMMGFGMVSGVSGLFLGQFLAEQIYTIVVPQAPPSLPIDFWVVIKSLGTSWLVCSIGGWWAYVQNTRSNDGLSRTTYILFGMIGMAVFFFGVLVEASGLVGAFVSIGVLSLFAASSVSPLLHTLRRQARRIRGSWLVRLGLREVIWFPRDLAVALAGLSLAVATAIGVGLMVDSFRGDFDRMLERRLAYDWSVVGTAPDLLKFKAAVEGASQLQRIQTYAKNQMRIQGIPLEVNVTRLDRYEARRYGISRSLQANEVLVGEQAARLLHLQIGDQLNLASNAYIVAGIFASFGDLLPRVVVQEIVGDANTVAVSMPDTINFNLVQSNSDDAAAWVEGLRVEFPYLEIHSQQSTRKMALETFDRTFAITSVLIAIAIMVAGIGLYIAITALRLNQTVSAKLLSTMGVNRWENLGVDLARGFGIGLCAILIALPLGWGLGWILCHVVNPRAFGWTVTMQLSPWPILGPVMWGLWFVKGRSAGGRCCWRLN